MEDENWKLFSRNDAVYDDRADDLDEFSPSPDLLLHDDFESEIVSKRFQEGGRLIFDRPPPSPRFPTGEFQPGYAYGDVANQSIGEVDSVMSIPPSDLTVKFDILRHRVVQEGKKKYVLYTIIIMEVPKLDTDQAIIERRYSDFHNLHKGLRKECPNALKDVAFPKKELFGNYDNTLLETRGRKFEKYLRFVFHQQGVRQCQAFKEFFYVRHLKMGTECLRSEDYTECIEQFRLGMQLQRKLHDSEGDIVATLCALVEVCKVQRNFQEAEKYAAEALELLQFDIDNPYLLPLMKITIDLRVKLKMDFGWLHNKLRTIEAKTAFDLDSPVTLRELAVKKF